MKTHVQQNDACPVPQARRGATHRKDALQDPTTAAEVDAAAWHAMRTQAPDVKFPLENLSMANLAAWVQRSPQDMVARALYKRRFYYSAYEDQDAAALDYQRLQRAISEQIPVERFRPTIDVRLVYNSEPGADIPTDHKVGILGGTGQLSDASVLVHATAALAQSAPTDPFKIHLLSIPPPRTHLEKLVGGRKYMGQVAWFAMRRHGRYFLVSNTAHLNYKKFKALTAGGDVFHLPKTVGSVLKSADLTSEGAFDPVIIMSTKQLWDGDLYTDTLSEAGVPHIQLSPQGIDEVQDWISRIKAAPLNRTEQLELAQYIRDLSAAQGSKNILLGCTELPYGLGDLKQTLESEGYRLFDSESILAQAIVRTLQRAGEPEKQAPR